MIESIVTCVVDNYGDVLLIGLHYLGHGGQRSLTGRMHCFSIYVPYSFLVLGEP